MQAVILAAKNHHSTCRIGSSQGIDARVACNSCAGTSAVANIVVSHPTTNRLACNFQDIDPSDPYLAVDESENTGEDSSHSTLEATDTKFSPLLCLQPWLARLCEMHCLEKL